MQHQNTPNKMLPENTEMSDLVMTEGPENLGERGGAEEASAG
jgi:hypothetical protein